MMRRVAIVSHADADGHLIAEQTRRNLELVPTIEVCAIIDPDRTRDHKVWGKLEELEHIKNADTVFFVDLMFSPDTFASEAYSLVQYVRSRKQTRFFLIDHHPIPYGRLQSAPNLRSIYRTDVFECSIGPRSGMMIVAALCEKQRQSVANAVNRQHEVLALGMRRAAALGGPLPGDKLLALLQADHWSLLLQLGLDSPEFHRLPRGRRSAKNPRSRTLDLLNEAATELLAITKEQRTLPSRRPQARRRSMPYDFDNLEHTDVSQERFDRVDDRRVPAQNAKEESRDLEAIVTLMEVAALSLTTEPGITFTVEELIQEVHELCGGEISIRETDVKIVLGKSGFLRKATGGLSLK